MLVAVLHGTDEANWVLAATYDTGAPVDLADPEDQRTVDRVAQHLAASTGTTPASCGAR